MGPIEGVHEQPEPEENRLLRYDGEDPEASVWNTEREAIEAWRDSAEGQGVYAERVTEQMYQPSDDIHRHFRQMERVTPAEGVEAKDLDEVRIERAAEQLKQMDELRPQNWREMDIYERRVTLDRVGRVLSDVYEHPSPPLIIEDMGNPATQGAYGDGYRFNVRSGEVEGSDYGIRMNEEALTERDQKLLGDNPKEALRTYAHEFRHSYQREQVNAYEKWTFRNSVDDLDTARTWSENFRNYQSPGIFGDNFDAYYQQPVEADARAFADRVVRKTYD